MSGSDVGPSADGVRRASAAPRHAGRGWREHHSRSPHCYSSATSFAAVAAASRLLVPRARLSRDGAASAASRSAAGPSRLVRAGPRRATVVCRVPRYRSLAATCSPAASRGRRSTALCHARGSLPRLCGEVVRASSAQHEMYQRR